VKGHLVSKGIPSWKVTTIGAGESQPTPPIRRGRQKNCRVDIEFKGVRRSNAS
jgi:outer membrane protein OmpA-like peptidoglycan-associated protein